MTNRRLLMASAILASVAITACSDTTAPKQAGLEGTSVARSGILRVTKECHDYHGQKGDHCTITSSNLKEIEIGSLVTYASAASPSFFLDSDVILDPPGPGNNVAFGHCTVDLTNINGTTGCIFSGGTGKFSWFHATVLLSLLPDSPELVWNGTYSFSPRD
jgi:hypothetical protein